MHAELSARGAPTLCSRGRLARATRRAAVALGLALMTSSAAEAREFGLHTPSGRRIYAPHERFDELLDHRRRSIISEVAVGAGPEGNLALLLGLLNVPVRHLDLFVGIGIEANPATLLTGSARYTLNLDGVRPYLSLGYLHKATYEVGVASHNVFAELGHTWVLHRTLRFSLGIGLRRIIETRVVEDSVLLDPEVDPRAVRRELDAIDPWLPLAAIRFSRAF
jgi:hypothetical protein